MIKMAGNLVSTRCGQIDGFQPCQHSEILARLAEPAGRSPGSDFEAAQARADEVRRPVSEARQIQTIRPSQLHRHPRTVNPMPKSRDFH